MVPEIIRHPLPYFILIFDKDHHTTIILQAWGFKHRYAPNANQQETMHLNLRCENISTNLTTPHVYGFG